MADALGLGLDMSGMATTVVNTAGMIIVGLIAVAFIGTIFYFFMKKKKHGESYKVIIYSQDGFGQITQRNDTATIHVDSVTKNKRLFVKNANVGLEADKIPYTMGSKGEKTVYLLQTGLKNFRFITVEIDVPLIDLKVGEEDVNWALNEFDRSIKMFESKNFLKEWGPYIMFLISVFAIVILLILLFNKFSVIESASQNLKEAAQYIAQAKSGTIVMGG